MSTIRTKEEVADSLLALARSAEASCAKAYAELDTADADSFEFLREHVFQVDEYADLVAGLIQYAQLPGVSAQDIEYAADEAGLSLHK